jgi:hypothetical protein
MSSFRVSGSRTVPRIRLTLFTFSMMWFSTNLLSNSPAFAQPADGDGNDIIDVKGELKSLPVVHFVPKDSASQPQTEAVARLVGLVGLYRPKVDAPGTKIGGLVVQVSAGNDNGRTQVQTLTTPLKGKELRRLVSFVPKDQSLDMARLADAVIEDLTGERSHLSGELVFSAVTKPGERHVFRMLASGANAREISPSNMLALGSDFGPGGKVFYAAATRGQPLRIYMEGKSSPLAVKINGHLQSVAFSQDKLKAAVVSGRSGNGKIYIGLLEGTMKPYSTKQAVAYSPSFGPKGELAYLAGPASGPMLVYVDGKRISPGGSWATSPTFCGKKRQLAYGIDNGSTVSSLIVDLDTGAVKPTGWGKYPACSPDGRGVAVSRKKRGNQAAGLYMLGQSGLSSKLIRQGTVEHIRWIAGPALPPSI